MDDKVPTFESQGQNLLDSYSHGSDGDDPLNIKEESTTEIYCVICGNIFSHIVIKKEVTDEDTFGSGELSSSATVHPNIPPSIKWSENETNILKWLLKTFKVKLSRKYPWNPESDSFPFCPSCKFELEFLVDLQRKVKELSNALKNGVQDLKRKVELSEDTFNVKGVYSNDKRYKKFRGQILHRKAETGPRSSTLPYYHHQPSSTKVTPETSNIHSISMVPEPKEEVCWNLSPPPVIAQTTRSGRKSKPVSRYNPHQDDKNLLLPIVLLSAEDKNKADYLLDKSSDDVGDCSEIFPGEIKQRKGSTSLKKIRKTRKLKFKKGIDSKLRKNVNYSLTSSKSDTEMVSNDDFDCNDFDDVNWEPDVDSKSIKRTRERKQITKDLDPDFGLSDDHGGLTEGNSDDSDDDETFIGQDRVKVVDPEKKTVRFQDILFNPIEDGQYQCEKCLEVVSRTRVRYHAIGKHTDIYKCQGCEKRFPIRRYLYSHQLRIHKIQPPPCYRPKPGTSVKKVTQEELICKVCGKPTKSRYILDLHMWTHYNREEREEIKARGEVTKSVSAVYLRVIQCEDCGSKHKTPISLERHRRKHHPLEITEDGLPNPNAGKELCPHCGLSFSDLASHIERRHQTSPSTLGNYPCTICGKVFATERNRRQHKLNVHTDLMYHHNRFECTLCEKPRKFVSKFKYTQHMNSHLNIRPFKCDQCTSSFTLKGHLDRHWNIYHNPDSTCVARRPAYLRGRTKKSKKWNNLQNPNEKKDKGSDELGTGTGLTVQSSESTPASSSSSLQQNVPPNTNYLLEEPIPQ